MRSSSRSPVRKAVKLSEDAPPVEGECMVRVPGTGDNGSEPREERERGQRRRREPRLSELQEAFLQLNVAQDLNTGNDGQTLELITNFFDIETLPKFVVHEYAVDFQPECVRRRSRLDVLNKLTKAKFMGLFAYDGMKVYLVEKLKGDEPGEDEEIVSTQCQFRGQQYDLIFKHVNIVTPNTLPYVQLLGILFRDRLIRLGMRTINRNL